MRFVVRATLWAILVSAVPASAQGEARLLRFPAIHGDTVVFTYAGDLYSVPSAGGIARKLTSHPGYEMVPRFSPDGKHVAFTGQYDGNTEVFLIPAVGGEPRRLTYTATLGRDDVSDRMGPNNLVCTWKNTTPEVVFRSRMRSFNSFIGSLFAVATDGGLPRQVPVPRGGFCSFSPDDKRMAYNRVFREYRTWKKYRGGMADDIWIYDFESKACENITNNPAQDIIPMWRGTQVYFLSDRDAALRMNLYVYDTATKQTRRLTEHREFDIKFPSIGPNAIVYENAGWIHRFDLKTEKTARIPITIADDRLTRRAGLRSVKSLMRTTGISPDGKRVVISARGDVFTVPAEHGPTRNVTRTSGAHDRDPIWSPDGKWIAFVSDRTGQEELYVVAQAGRAAPRAVTKGGVTYKFAPRWSPDSKKLLWSDRRMRLRFADVENGAITEVATAKAWEIRQYDWSPDSAWITYARDEVEGMSRVYLYSVAGKTTTAVTAGWYGSNSPSFSRDGKFLCFASARDFDPIYSATEWNHAYHDMERIYLVALSANTPSPFRPKSDEVAARKPPKKDDEKAANGKARVEVEVDLRGIRDRVVGLPIAASNYGAITADGDHVYYVRNGSADEKPRLLLYDLKKRKEVDLGAWGGYDLSADGKKMLVRSGGKLAIVDRPTKEVAPKKGAILDLSGLESAVDPRAEWRQIFDECCRQMREFFYAPNMHGIDWAAMQARYVPLVEHVAHRNDLTYVIGELIGELSVGHAYVGGGVRPTVERRKLGLLGAELSRDASGAYRIDRILRGENWRKGLRSPLTEIGVDAAVGEFIVAVDGAPTKDMANIFAALVGKAGHQVTLTLADDADGGGGREVTVVPIADESGLYYRAWVQGNIAKVHRATGGKVGYLHIPDMGRDGLNEFVKHYYPQLRKKALIIDVRGNGGGNVSPMIIERLRRKLVFHDMARNVASGTDPTQTFLGPLVCLCDEFSASDGDIFPYRFKFHKLGTLIGKRTWGGVVGIRGSLPLIDGGSLHKPEFAIYDAKGEKWVIEGYGVDPDVVVDNEPGREFAGVDQQLDAGIANALKRIKDEGEPRILPPPQFPKKK